VRLDSSRSKVIVVFAGDARTYEYFIFISCCYPSWSTIPISAYIFRDSERWLYHAPYTYILYAINNAACSLVSFNDDDMEREPYFLRYLSQLLVAPFKRPWVEVSIRQLIRNPRPPRIMCQSFAENPIEIKSTAIASRIRPFFAFAKSLLLVHSAFLIDTFTSNSHVSCYYERAYL